MTKLYNFKLIYKHIQYGGLASQIMTDSRWGVGRRNDEAVNRFLSEVLKMCLEFSLTMTDSNCYGKHA
jgi:hypothetical protein